MSAATSPSGLFQFSVEKAYSVRYLIPISCAALQTVSTFLSRLVKKGFLNMYRKGRYCYYQPLVSKEDFWRATMEESAKFFTKGDLGELACCLCDDMLDAKDIEKLKKKLNEHS